MLVYTGILSAPALALPSLGKEHAKAYAAFAEAIGACASTLQASAYDALVLISPDGHRYAQAMGLSVHDPYITSLAQIGHYEDGLKVPPALACLSALQHAWERSPFQVSTHAESTIDFTSSSCLTILDAYSALPPSLAVCAPPRENASLLFSYGNSLRDVCEQLPQRIAVLFSCFLSCRHSELSPGGAHPQSPAFDERLQQSLIDGNSTPILRADDALARELGSEDALTCFRMAAGLLSEWRCTPLWHGYETVFGMGNTAMSFVPKVIL
jgi:aromatic ring-opening dioxygenase LigB subunit